MAFYFGIYNLSLAYCSIILSIYWLFAKPKFYNFFLYYFIAVALCIYLKIDSHDYDYVLSLPVQILLLPLSYIPVKFPFFETVQN